MYSLVEMIKSRTLITLAKFQQRLLLFYVALQLLIWRNTLVVAVNVERINPYEKISEIQLNGRWWMGGGGPNNRSHYASDAVQEMWLTQKLDHFLKEGGQTTNQSRIEEQWMMRYLVNREFYEPGGPMFIVVGGEWEIHPYLLSEGHFYDMARQHNSIMFYTEHRFYGKSWPKNSASVDALEYLSVRQSLEDLRYFIKYQKSSQKDLVSSKVVLLGASYSGSMVAWFMKLYPNEANVAWASSAPLLAKMDFHEFMTLTMDVIEHKGGTECSEKLEKGFQDLRRILLSSSASKELLYNLQMCSDFDVDNELDISAFFNGLGNYFAAMAQLSSKFVTQFCQQFMENDTTPTDALVQHIRDVFLPHSEDETKSHGHGQIWCLDLSYEGMKSLFSSEDDDIFNGNRCWFYQTCNEFGWFATTTSTDVTARNVFGGQVALKFFRNLCQDVFQRTPLSPNMPSAGGLTLQELYSRERRTNHIFGGLTNISQNVIFTHGRLDPWRAVGMQHGRNVLLLEGYGHVEDLGSINLEDSVALNVAKLKVSAFINKALRES
ncbi:putative serine protease K12H4.7 [Musca domestica]|uniref:Serine protease K12H4.7 n=1 Tax=Musca domestica TaxID=7370 RepID=A0ABM3VHY4_MUSDO|nr:putative serine protease K12H4.7 [Musca domestica]